MSTEKKNCCHATVADRSKPSSTWHYNRLRCRYRWQELRLDGECRPRLLCGIHAKSKAVRWSNETEIDLRYLDDDTLIGLEKLCKAGVKELERRKAALILAYHRSILKISEQLQEVQCRKEEIGL